MGIDETTVPASLWRTVQRLHGGGAWPPQETDAQCFVDAVRWHRLLPLAAVSALPEPAAGIARAAQRADASRVAGIVDMQRETLARLIEALPAETWVAIKGADYGPRLYGDPHLREMDDIDVLVRADRLDASVAALTHAGFVVRPGTSTLEVSFADPVNGVVIDLYHALIQRTRVAIDYDALFAGATIDADGCARPSPAHALVAHALVMANLQYVTHLRKYVDLWLLCRDAGIVNEAIDTARRWRMRRAFYATMQLFAEAIPETRDAAWWPALEALLAPSERRAMHRWVLPRDPVVPMPSRPFAVWRKFGLIDGNDQRLRFVAGHCIDGVRRRLAR